MMKAKLVILDGNVKHREIRLNLPLTIGRSPEAGITINHPGVSRFHCEIRELNGALIVRDFKSANGTLINDVAVTEGVLRMADILKVGPISFAAIYKHKGPYPEIQPRGAASPPQ